MHFVTGGAELGRILRMNGFMKRAAVRLGIQVGQEVIRVLDELILAAQQFVQRRVFAW